MKNVKLRLDYLKSKGILAACGDELSFNGCDFVVVDNDTFTTGLLSKCEVSLKVANATCDSSTIITSFAPRKNTGSQPVSDDVPVIVELAEDGEVISSGEKRIALNLDWRKCAYKYEVESWKPNLSELIKMQIEHDAKIDAETKAEFDKLNKRQLSTAEIFSKSGPSCAEAIKGLNKLHEAINKMQSNKAHEIITNQHEIHAAMSESANKNEQEKFDKGTIACENINRPKQGDKRRIEYCSNNSGQLEIEQVTFMFDTDKEICCLDSDGLMLIVDKEEFVAWHAVISELETAKKKQITDALNAVNHSEYLVSRESIRLIQDAGMLREITLPLEK